MASKKKKITSKQENVIHNMIANAIQLLIIENSSHSPQYFFDSIWKFATQNFIHKTNFFGGPILPEKNYFFDRFQLNIYEYFLVHVTFFLQEAGIDFAPDLKVKTDALPVELSAPDKSMIIIGVHNAFAFGARLASHYNRSISVISSEQGARNTMKLTGVKTPINFIENDMYSLAKFQELILRGEVLVVAVDYEGPNKKYVYINTNIFEFARTQKIPLYFMSTEVADNGSVIVEFSKAVNANSINDQADSFIDFINNHKRSKRELSTNESRI